MKKRLYLAEIASCCVAAAVIMTFASGCSEGASSPEATVKMAFADALIEIEEKKCIFEESGYNEWRPVKEAYDTLSIEKVEKNEDNDCAVVFYTFMKESKDYYDVSICKKIKDGPWVLVTHEKNEIIDKFKEEVRKQIINWKNKKSLKIRRPAETYCQDRCLSNMKQFGTALQQYESAYLRYPTQGFEGMETLRTEYMNVPKIYICPSSKDIPAEDGEPVASYHNCSFIYLGSKKLTKKENGKFPVLIDKPQNHSKGIGVLHLDDTVTRVRTKEKSAVKFLQKQYDNGKGFDPENWRIAIEEAAKWDKLNGL